jgi:ferric iron reductase protein FhuF
MKFNKSICNLQKIAAVSGFVIVLIIYLAVTLNIFSGVYILCNTPIERSVYEGNAGVTVGSCIVSFFLFTLLWFSFPHLNKMLKKNVETGNTAKVILTGKLIWFIYFCIIFLCFIFYVWLAIFLYEYWNFSSFVVVFVFLCIAIYIGRILFRVNIDRLSCHLFFTWFYKLYLSNKMRFILCFIFFLLCSFFLIHYFCYQKKKSGIPLLDLNSIMENAEGDARLAAAIILTGKGDDRASWVFSALYSSLDTYRKNRALFWLEKFGNCDKIASHVISLFMEDCEHTGSGGGFCLIAPGREKEFIQSLRKISSKWRITYFNGTRCLSAQRATEYLIRADDREFLNSLRLKLVKKFQKSEKMQYSDRCECAELFLYLYSDDYVTGYNKLFEEIPLACDEYFSLMIGRGHLAESVKVFKGIHRGDKKYLKFKRKIASAWDNFPDEIRKTFSEKERDSLLLENARFHERTGTMLSREAFLRLLKEPGGSIISSFSNRIRAGDTDLREILIKKVMSIKDINMLRDISFALYYRLDGIPEDVAEHLENVVRNDTSANSSNQLISLRNQILNLCLSPTRKYKKFVKKTALWNNIKSLISWLKQIIKPKKAEDELKEIRMGVESYFVDNSRYPVDLHNITTPIAYVNEVYTDKNTKTGNYKYFTNVYCYAVSSAGKDGEYNIPIDHFCLFWAFAQHKEKKKKIGCFVSWSGNEYIYPEKDTPGSDMIISHK